jgi:hypothetical protein
VIAMSQGHLAELAARFPDAAPPAYVLRAFERGPAPQPDGADLADPIGEPLQLYRDQLRTMQRCIDHLTLYLKRGAAAPTDG